MAMNMHSQYPAVTKNEKKIRIAFGPSGHTSDNLVTVSLILDLDLNGQVIGIEALNYSSYGGANSLPTVTRSELESAGMRLSYDEAVDVLYLKIDDGRSVNQRGVNGTVFFDLNRRMIGIEADLP
jgi:uncharacterized protein YuzE